MIENTNQQIRVIKISNATSSYAKRAEGHLLMYMLVGRMDRGETYKAREVRTFHDASSWQTAC
ncbi:hypothetical protein V5T82_06130 [Magnetovibrio sp. PR-2]|uniref:hypothetical protein n=1 Tax=Magnetovibrio sp. PR-2 TaxID=3120356 RepID=UPI002FCDE47E